MSQRVVLADVLYTETDETFYVLNGKSDYEGESGAVTLEDAAACLARDGWYQYGVVYRWDDKVVPMWCRRPQGSFTQEYLAVWVEPEGSVRDQSD